MAAFKKGRAKTGGRSAGTPNKATDSIKNLLNRLLPEERLAAEWEHHLKHKDQTIRWKAFELANAYLFGQPVKPIQGAEDAPPVHIDISAIPRKRKRADGN
jgi:hypothetical protein